MPELDDTQLDVLIAALRLGQSRPGRGPGARAACGTPSGYLRHIKDGNEPCTACRAANTRAKKEQYHRATGKELPPIAHGTPQGARQHWYRKDPVCEPCRTAYNARQNQRRSARKGGAQ